MTLVLALAGCAASSTVPPDPSAPVTQRTVPAGTAGLVTTRFGAIALTHPARWREYLTPGDGDLSNGDGAYLSDQPIRPRCTQTPAGPATFVRCPGELDFPQGPGPGRVWIEVALDYAPRGPRPHGDLDVDGYRTEMDASVNNALGFPADSSGFPVPFCSSHTDFAVQATATASTTAVQPSGFAITACFGVRTGPDRHAFRAMLRTATVTTTPSQSASVAGAPGCDRADLRLSYDAEGVSQSIVSTYTFTNTAGITCMLGGYPRLVLDTASGGTADHVTYRHTQHASPLYLQPGSSVQVHTQAFLNYDLRRYGLAPSEQVYLPGVPRPFTLRLPRGGLPIYPSGQDIDVSPFQGT